MFRAAFENRLPVLLKGPTGCGKTRFVAHMAARLGRPLYTVACHDDLSAADLIGRYLLKGGETVWVDGPLTRAVREGAICYLDEVVEARKDVTVVLHPLTDDRRILPIDRTGEELEAAPRLHAGGQLQPRLPEHPENAETLHPAALRGAGLHLPARPSTKSPWSPAKAACPKTGCNRWCGWRTSCARMKGQDLEEGVSTRLVIYAATLIRQGMAVDRAILAAMIEPLTDDADTKRGLLDLVTAVFG